MAWRFQDIDGYVNYDMEYQLGSWNTNQRLKKHFSRSAIAIKRFIKITVASQRTGACVQRNIVIDPVRAKQLGAWKYVRIGNKIEMIPFARNKK